MKNILDTIKKIHFIGIGGSGMCPMAGILHRKGYLISGSDTYESDTLSRIKDLGIKVFMDHNPENVTGSDLVVYSAAIKEENPERVKAKELGIPQVERSVMLGMITRKYKNPIAISGTHGKTTTTAMLTQILVTAGSDPTAIIGGKLPFIGGNSRIGNSETIICEACEYVDSFLELEPAVSVILNVDADHLDYFKTLDNIILSFNKFANQTTSQIIVNGDDENSIKALTVIKKPVITYGLGNHNDYYADNISQEKKVYAKFDLMKNGNKLTEISLSVPGRHNIYNALAAAATADFLGVKAEKIFEGLKNFRGVHRRFEVLGTPQGITIVDDFAHHPTELKATLSTAMSLGFKKVYAVFQPHTYSRTFMLLNDFAEALSIADEVVLSEILAVREENVYNIFSEDLAAKTKNCKCFKTFDQITDYITSTAQEGDLVITLGGGNVYKCANMIFEKLSGGLK